jgi:hypothetical protein
MSIPYGESFHTTAHGCLPKRVRCEECDHKYYYVLQRSATGEGTNLLFIDKKGAQRRSVRNAKANLQQALSSECDPVPCPKCGWYQQDMVRRARQLHHRWLAQAALWVFSAAAVLAVLAIVTIFLEQRLQHEVWQNIRNLLWILAAACVILSLAFGATKLIVSSGYDPNQEEVKERKRLGKQLTITREEYEEMIQNLT